MVMVIKGSLKMNYIVHYFIPQHILRASMCPKQISNLETIKATRTPLRHGNVFILTLFNAEKSYPTRKGLTQLSSAFV